MADAEQRRTLCALVLGMIELRSQAGPYCYYIYTSNLLAFERFVFKVDYSTCV